MWDIGGKSLVSLSEATCLEGASLLLRLLQDVVGGALFADLQEKPFAHQVRQVAAGRLVADVWVQFAVLAVGDALVLGDELQPGLLPGIQLQTAPLAFGSRSSSRMAGSRSSGGISAWNGSSAIRSPRSRYSMNAGMLKGSSETPVTVDMVAYRIT